MEQDKLAFVDVDNTLWDFDSELRKRMVEELKLTVPKEWKDWGDPIDIIGDNQKAFDLFNEMHYDQDLMKPYKAAGLVLKDLRRLGYKILIATNRVPESCDALVAWLDGNDLIYDEIYCDIHKKELFATRKIDLAIDDSPEIIAEALKHDVRILSLRFSYNNQIPGPTKFSSLQEMHEYLIQELIMSI